MLSLRFLPTHGPELQVTFTIPLRGPATLATVTVLNASVWSRADNTLRDHGVLDPASFVVTVPTVARPVPIQRSESDRWYARFIRAVRDSANDSASDAQRLANGGEATVVLDGTTYDLVWNPGLLTSRWTVLDEELDARTATGRMALTRWMNELRLFAAAQHGVHADVGADPRFR